MARLRRSKCLNRPRPRASARWPSTSCRASSSAALPPRKSPRYSSGATITSNALKEAVKAALAQAK
ncbi:MAG: FMN-binding protein [Christensenellales bacterium]